MNCICQANQRNSTIQEVGGKAYNLIHLVQYGFHVPSFFVLTSSCFVEFLGEHYQEYCRLLENYNKENRLKIIELIDSIEFTDSLKISIMQEMQATFSSKDEVSVRSSATDEDSSTHSFAGMMESYLNIPQDKRVFEAIKACYQSCFSNRIMEYRQANGLIDASIKVAVIIQKMINPDYAGVLFTTNPQTNNTDEMLISVVKGVGESLVSGESDSSDYIIDLLDTIVSRKEVDGISLSNELLLQLHSLGLAIEKSYQPRLAQDIEYCIINNEIYILQSRSIATYNYVDKSLFRTILDNSNIIESYSGVTTPLTFTFAREVYAKVYNQTLSTFCIKQENIDAIQDDLANMLAFFENKIYYRLNSWYTMTSLYPNYEDNSRYMENMMGVKVTLNETKKQAKSRLMKIYIRFLYKMLRLPKDSKGFKERFTRITSPYYNQSLIGKSNEELLEIYTTLESKILDDFIIPITNDMCAMVFYGKLTEAVQKINPENYEGMISSILSKQGDVESVHQTLDLMDIVEMIRKDTSLKQLFLESSNEQLAYYLENSKEEVWSKLENYIYNYGARSMDELKLETITMQQDPSFLFDMIKQYLELNTTTQVYSTNEDSNQEEELYLLCSGSNKLKMKLLVSITKYFIKNRESLRLRRTYIYSIVRNIFLAIGYNFVKEGIIQEQRDIFYLTKEEIFNAIRTQQYNTNLLQSNIINRKEEYNQNKDKKIYERMYFYGEVTSSNALPVYSMQETSGNDSHILTGVAGGGSVVEGIVKLVNDPSDANIKGYILMAKRTDPGWTVLFPMAEAIIIERGSVLSHSAVVAREMGLTLVVGIRGLTDIIQDGMKVRVDGINGTVEVLEGYE